MDGRVTPDHQPPAERLGDVAALAARLAEAVQAAKPHTFGDSEYMVLWRLAEANLKQTADEIDRLTAELQASKAREAALSTELKASGEREEHWRTIATQHALERDAFRQTLGSLLGMHPAQIVAAPASDQEGA
jgi:hypothetical protein